jgi:glycosyltransferase involved in cell wall biosynthesis
MKHKVLIVSFFFPPANLIGAVRVGKFAKYLPEFGWEPMILTVDKIQDSSQTMPLEIDESKITRTPYFTFRDIVVKWFTHDEQTFKPNQNQQKSRKKHSGKINLSISRLAEHIYTLPVINPLVFEPMGWYRYAIKSGLEIVKQNNIDIIFSSSGPFTSHLIASQLHRKTKIPWVAEFRDPWTMNEYVRHTQPFYLLQRWWEKKTMKNCQYLIDVSPTLANRLVKLHSKKTIVIPNGFDEDDYLENVQTTSKFCITYTGNVYFGRDPSPLFQALAELDKEKKITNSEIEVRFFGGNVIETVSSLIDEYGIKEYVKTFGFVSLKESIEKQKESTILLLMSWISPRSTGTLSGKIFEYIGAGKPILAFALKGDEIERLLQETGCGLIVNEVGEIKSVLLKWLKEFKDDRKITSFYNPDKDNIKKYTRREQAQKLAKLFEKINSNIN